MHVPGIASWPGRIPGGRVCDDLVTAVDFLPTICELAGEAAPPGDGRSFAAQLRGEPGTPREWIYSWYSPRQNQDRTVREFAFDRRHKLYAGGDLYDLVADPDEERPIPPDAASPAAAAAAVKLRAAIDGFANARPAALDRATDDDAAASPKASSTEDETEDRRPRGRQRRRAAAGS